MSALKDYADVIKRERETVLCPTPVTPRELLQHTIVALADELESLRDDAALSALVRQMPPFSRLRLVCAGTRNVWRYEGPGLYPISWSDTPEAALLEALGEEQDGAE